MQLGKNIYMDEMLDVGRSGIYGKFVEWVASVNELGNYFVLS